MEEGRLLKFKATLGYTGRETKGEKRKNGDKKKREGGRERVNHNMFYSELT